MITNKPGELAKENEVKILVADDAVAIVDLLKEFLVKKGHQVDTVSNGEKAVDFIKTHDYDLAILDENMPDLSGLEVAKFIKVNKPNIKTIILTGYPLIDESFAKFSGVNEFLQKPVKLEEIESIIQKLS